jgi:hypothetical protein
MSEQFKKLDLLPGLLGKVEALKTEMDYSNTIMDEIRAENKTLKTTMDFLNYTTERLRYDNKTMAAELLDLKCEV